jgi:cyclophilin family peptidyl-prolyl cis-trans isomerase
MRRALLTAALLLAAAPARAEDAAEPTPRVGSERVVLSTTAGDIVLALYPDVAPKHVEQILKLVKLGVYDSTDFSRIEPGFVAQLTAAEARQKPLTNEQKAALHDIPAEFSVLKHHRGTVSMAHQDGKPDSGRTSFSILLGDAPHLDRQYTVFGHVERGLDVVDELCKVPRRRTTPVVRLEVTKAAVVDAEQLKYLELRPATAVPVPADALESNLPAWAVAGGVGLMVLVGVVCFLFGKRLAPRVQASLHLVSVLVGGWLILAVLLPLAQALPWLALLVFVGVLGLLRLMSQFESPA